MVTPFPSKRAPVYKDIPDDKWNDWRWQLSHRLNSPDEFEQIFKLTDSERKALSTPNLFRVDVTPYFVSLINPDDPEDPVRRQVIPTADEITPFTGMITVEKPRMSWLTAASNWNAVCLSGVSGAADPSSASMDSSVGSFDSSQSRSTSCARAARHAPSRS